MCYMKHEADEKRVNLKPKAENAESIIKFAKVKSAAKKPAGNADLKVQKQNSFKKSEVAKKELTSNVSTRILKKKAEKPVSKISSKIVQAPKIKTIVSIKKIKPEVRKVKMEVLRRQVKQKVEKTAPKSPINKIELKILKAKIISPAKIVHPTLQNLKTTVSAKITKPTVETKKPTAKNISPTTKITSKERGRLPLSKAKKNLITSVKTVQIKAPKDEKVTTKKAKTVGAKINVVNPPILAPPKKKKIKPISSAIFRGKKDRYSFAVFSLTDEFEPVPAVFIISRRKTDRLKKAHHSLICIGQTNSIFDELKKHRKGKCVKKHQANVVSILPEANEKIRVRIENDLKAAHSVVCSFE